MERETLIAKLRDVMPDLSARHGVLHLDLFGSFARGTAHEGSDVDLLVTFQGEPTFEAYMGLKEDLEALLGRGVDLITSSGLKSRIRQRVMRDLLHVA